MNKDTLDSSKEKDLKCCVKNCQKPISDDKMEINGKYFCKVCGTAYYKSVLGL